VDIGTNQMHPKLRVDNRVGLHEKTDIMDFWPDEQPDIIMIDMSFTSLKPILEYVKKRCSKSHNIIILAMLKPQFEAKPSELNNGVVKNSTIRRKIIKDFERNIRGNYVVCGKRDNNIAGSHGNVERFYMLRLSLKR
jgi:23S rRNA (cytidine1920-2'-O)/16S rRNA (cytidine1409-2'-O)-methyltransferase